MADYKSILQNMPEPYRSRLIYGEFKPIDEISIDVIADLLKARGLPFDRKKAVSQDYVQRAMRIVREYDIWMLENGLTT